MYAGAPYGGGSYAGSTPRPVAEHLAAADSDELKRLAEKAERITLERSLMEATAYLVELGWRPPQPSKTRGQAAATRVFAILGWVMTAIQFMRAGGPAWTAEQLMEWFDRASRR